MAAPTVVAFDQSVWNNVTTPKTATITVQSGDRIVVGTCAEGDSTTFSTPTNDGAALTWTVREIAGAASNTKVQQWTATADSARTIVITFVRTGTATNWWGCYARAWRGSDGFGNTAKVEGDTTANFSVDIVTTQANSGIDVLMGDWNAVTGARTYLTATAGTFTQQVNEDHGSNYAVRGGYHADAGTTGTKTVGTSAPSGQDLSIVVVEVLGTASGGDANVAAPAATATAEAPVPTVSAEQNLTGDGPASATAEAQAPVVQADALIQGLVATATADAPASTVSTSGDALVAPPAALADAGGAGPSLVAEAALQAPAATATAVAPSPTVEALLPVYAYSPPTHEEPIRTRTDPLGHYRLTYANSIVRVNGTFTSIRTPAPELLTGVEGRDWFRGGYVYQISAETAAELAAAGFMG